MAEICGNLKVAENESSELSVNAVETSVVNCNDNDSAVESSSTNQLQNEMNTTQTESVLSNMLENVKLESNDGNESTTEKSAETDTTESTKTETTTNNTTPVSEQEAVNCETGELTSTTISNTCSNDVQFIKTEETQINDVDNEENQVDIEIEYEKTELNEFLLNAYKFGANALDLSKKNLFEIPKLLYKLSNLQYLYLGGNNLTELPTDFFTVFTYLQWLDLRDNKLTQLPTNGLASHEGLRYLLLENNQITRLPVEIAFLTNLTALNINGNPLEFPPAEVVKMGVKHMKEYLREHSDLISRDTMRSRQSTQAALLTDDVWASDDDEYYYKRVPSSKYRTKSAKTVASSGYKRSLQDQNSPLAKINHKALTTQPLHPSNDSNTKLKSRLNRAKLEANNFSKSNIKYKKVQSLYEQAKTTDFKVYKNHDFEKAMRNGKVDQYKKRKEKIDVQLEKVKTQKIVDEFRDELKDEQRKNMFKNMVKGVDYVEPVRNAPFDVDEDHIMIMTNEERAALDERLLHERTRSLSPETLWKIEEERRLRDHALQDKIREYTNKLLAKRDAPKGEPKKDRIDAAKDLRELKAIEKELEQRRTELQYRFRAFTGDLRYKETAKINAAATATNILRKTKYNS